MNNNIQDMRLFPLRMVSFVGERVSGTNSSAIYKCSCVIPGLERFEAFVCASIVTLNPPGHLSVNEIDTYLRPFHVIDAYSFDRISQDQIRVRIGTRTTADIHNVNGNEYNIEFFMHLDNQNAFDKNNVIGWKLAPIMKDVLEQKMEIPDIRIGEFFKPSDEDIKEKKYRGHNLIAVIPYPEWNDRKDLDKSPYGVLLNYMDALCDVKVNPIYGVYYAKHYARDVEFSLCRLIGNKPGKFCIVTRNDILTFINSFKTPRKFVTNDRAAEDEAFVTRANNNQCDQYERPINKVIPFNQMIQSKVWQFMTDCLIGYYSEHLQRLAFRNPRAELHITGQDCVMYIFAKTSEQALCSNGQIKYSALGGITRVVVDDLIIYDEQIMLDD